MSILKGCELSVEGKVLDSGYQKCGKLSSPGYLNMVRERMRVIRAACLTKCSS